MTASFEWITAARCGEPEFRDLPWIADAGEASPAQVAAMARVCSGCPVRLACAAFASPGGSSDGVTAGFWAGRERGSLEVPDLLDMLDDITDTGAAGSVRAAVGVAV